MLQHKHMAVAAQTAKEACDAKHARNEALKTLQFLHLIRIKQVPVHMVCLCLCVFKAGVKVRKTNNQNTFVSCPEIKYNFFLSGKIPVPLKWNC